MSLFDTVTDEDVLKELMEIEVTTLTPLDALNTLYRLQNKFKEPLERLESIREEIYGNTCTGLPDDRQDRCR